LNTISYIYINSQEATEMLFDTFITGERRKEDGGRRKEDRDGHVEWDIYKNKGAF